MKISGSTDKGKKRSNNEDSFLVDSKLGIMIVADGMGGHASGEVASQLATQLCLEQLKRAVKTGHVPVNNPVRRKPFYDPLTFLLGDCVKFANQAVYEAGQQVDTTNRMGTTIVAALWLDGKLAVAHVGDSRLYLIRQGDISLCTVDHTFIQEQLDKGLMKPEEAENSDFRNMLTRSVGFQPDVDVDLKEVELTEGDYILLCSDGLTKMMTDEQIVAVFNDKKEPDKIVNELISQANSAGGHDNTTAIVALVQGAPSTWTSLKDRFVDILHTGKSGSEKE